MTARAMALSSLAIGLGFGIFYAKGFSEVALACEVFLR